jgi:threonine/homoserine/homoserine lactone efflux protein
MLGYLTTGVTYAFAAAVQPGPFQAYLISLVLRDGWRRTLPAVFAPLLSDIPAACLAIFVLTQIPPVGVNALRLVGGVFLLYLAAGALRAWRGYEQAVALSSPRPAQRTLVNAVTVNLLNPNPYLGWSTVIGPALVEAWRLAPWYGVALVASFYATMIAATAVLLAAFAAAHALGPRVGRVLLGVSALALAGFGVYQLSFGVRALVPAL